MKKTKWSNKQYSPTAVLEAILDAGIASESVGVFGNGPDFNLMVEIYDDDPSGAIEQTVRDIAAAHDASQLSSGEQQRQDRAQIVNHFDLDAEDRTFIRDLSQVFTLAESNTISPQRVYDEIKAVVDASDKHREGVAYWYNMKYEINLLNGVTLTTQDKRRYVECVELYYARKLAPALTVWLMRGGLNAPDSSG